MRKSGKAAHGAGVAAVTATTGQTATRDRSLEALLGERFGTEVNVSRLS